MENHSYQIDSVYLYEFVRNAQNFICKGPYEIPLNSITKGSYEILEILLVLVGLWA